MEGLAPGERIDVNRVLAEAEQRLAAGDLHAFENFVHALEAARQRYVEVERQSTAAVRQMEQEFAALRNELAYSPAALERYRELQLSHDLHLSRLQAGRKEAEALGGILLKLRPEMERFVGRHKAVELAAQARAVREELRQLKTTFLPVLEQVVEKIFALNNAAAAFNRTMSVGHLPQTQFLRCRVDLRQFLATLAELDVVVTPEMETLAASEKKTTSRNVQPPRLTLGEEELYDRVARKAYELYQQRGEAHGYDLVDWLTAEQLVREEPLHDPLPEPVIEE